MTLIFCGTNRLSLVPFSLETVLPHPLDTPVQRDYQSISLKSMGDRAMRSCPDITHRYAIYRIWATKS
jgi:hypothetical protein